MTWRYIAQHPNTGDLIDLELPLSGVVLTRRLSGPWGMTAKITPEVARMFKADGSRLLDEWAVQVWADDGVNIRGGGILTASAIAGDQWDLTFEGHARYPYGIPYDGNTLSLISADPLDIFRTVWAHVQSYPDGNLGVVVDPTKSDIRLGVPTVPAFYEVSFSPEGTPDQSQVWVPETPDNIGRVDPAVTVKITSNNTRLSNNIGHDATAAAVTNANFKGWPTPFIVKCDNEYIQVGAVSNDGRTLGQFTRGYDYDGRLVFGDQSAHEKGTQIEYVGMGLEDTLVRIADPEKLAGVSAPFTVKCGSEYLRVRARSGATLSQIVRGWDPTTGTIKPATVAPHKPGAECKYAGTPRRLIEAVPAEPYTLAWWDAVDCGDELETLAKETPFEFVEDHTWNADRTAISHRLRIGYPRIGRRRDDITFVEGENLAVVPTVQRDGEVFGQYVIGLGAGEGSKRRRTPTIGSPDGRLRRPHVLERTDVTSADRLARLATAEHSLRRNMASIPDVVLIDHSNARLGSWQLGDEVLVTLRYGWARESVWCRIIEETVTPENDGRAVALKLTRADGL